MGDKGGGLQKGGQRGEMGEKRRGRVGGREPKKRGGNKMGGGGGRKIRGGGGGGGGQRGEWGENTWRP